MRAGSYHSFWSLVWSGQILRSSQTPSLGASSSRISADKSWALPGIDWDVKAGSYFDQLDRRNYEATTSFQGQGSTYFQQSLIDSAKPRYLDSPNHRAHLESLQDPQQLAISTPPLIQFVKEFAQLEGRIILFQRALKWLLEVEEMPQDHVATWVELFTVSYHASSAKLSLRQQFHALFGLHSLLNKYTVEKKEEIVRYIQTAIEIFERSVLFQPEPFEDLTVPWVTGMLSLDGLSPTYENFEKITSYEHKFNDIRTAINNGEVKAIEEQLPSLKRLALKETAFISAQTKTAAILYLYHVASMKDQWIKHTGIQSKAANILKDLAEPVQRDSLALHDLKLVEKILEQWRGDPIHANRVLGFLYWMD